MKLFDSLKKRVEKGNGKNQKAVSDIRILEIYPGMRVVVEDPDGRLLFIAKLQELQQNTAELYQYSEGENLREMEADNLHEVYHIFVKLRGYNDSQRKAVFMEGMITPLRKHVWRVENLLITKVENERAFPRFTTDIDAVILSDGEGNAAKKCRLLNISAGGTCVSSEQRYDKGDTFLLKVRLLEDEEPFVVYCEVVRVMVRGGEFEYGCCFVELTEVDQEQMSRRIEQFAARR